MPSRKSNSLFYFSQLWSIIIMLLLGIFFRFAKIEDKVFWVDEVATAVRVSGYTIPEVIEDLQARDIVSHYELLKYQRINQNRNLSDTWQALTKSPEHAPLYFLLTRFWLQLWGNSLGVMRSLSAWLSLLVFPTLYWLYQELFNKPLISCLGIVLMSVSPFYVAYAQEARPYSLWTLTILLMGVSLLRAIRINNRQNWALYIVSLVFGLYTSLLSLFIVGFHGIYLLIANFKNKPQVIKNYIRSFAIAFLLFSPWLIIIITKMQTLQDNTNWMRSSMDITTLIATWIGTILLIFGDLPLSSKADPIHTAIAVIVMLIVGIGIFYLAIFWHILKPIVKQIIRYITIILITGFLMIIIFFGKYFFLDIVTLIGAIVAIIILALASYSFCFLVKNSERSQWLFIVCLIISLPVPLFLADIIYQGQSSSAPRYLIPTQLGIQIAAAYSLGSKIQHGSLTSVKQQKIWSIITIAFLSLGVFSCTRNLNLSPIYLKSRNIHNPEIAQIINNQQNPLILVESEVVGDILSLSHDLSAPAKIKAISPKISQDAENQVSSLAIANQQDNFLKYQHKFSNLYILKPSSGLKTKLVNNSSIIFQKAYQSKLLTPEQIALDLWEIKNK